MKCRHCLTEFAEEQIEHRVVVGRDKDGAYMVFRYQCPKRDCQKENIYFVTANSGQVILEAGGINLISIPTFGDQGNAGGGNFVEVVSPDTIVWSPIYPKGSGRPPIPPEVDDPAIASDYSEACLVLSDSPKASAALSRRCLEQILERKLGSRPTDSLFEKIEHAKGKLPDYIAEDLHAAREIGNFGAHPRKSTNTGEILPVLPGEAEWNLDVLEELFEFLYVSPKKKEEARKELNQKLADAGKKPVG